VVLKCDVHICAFFEVKRASPNLPIFPYFVLSTVTSWPPHFAVSLLDTRK